MHHSNFRFFLIIIFSLTLNTIESFVFVVCLFFSHSEIYCEKLKEVVLMVTIFIQMPLFLNQVFFLCSAFGFHLEESLFSFNQKCIEDPDSGINIHKPPSPCPPGTFYPYSRGYQKIPGDTCQYGEDYRYDPLMYSCPVAGTHKQFLMLLLR